MMVDCWRRLYFYWKSRRNWKSVTWHYTYEWHAHKMKGMSYLVRFGGFLLYFALILGFWLFFFLASLC